MPISSLSFIFSLSISLCLYPSLPLFLPLSLRDEDMDGEWEAPQVPNPACEAAPGCGKWEKPTIDNPSYKGKWKPPMIDNPNYQVTAPPWSGPKK